MKRSFLILPFITVILMNCERAEEPVPDTTPTLTTIQAEIFDVNCALSGCHTGANPPQGMSLADGITFSNTVNVNSNEQPLLFRIKPGNPDMSYLYMKITGAPEITGSQMPLGRSPLPEKQLEQIRLWIEGGALDN
jgi:hypothetical protein